MVIRHSILRDVVADLSHHAQISVGMEKGHGPNRDHSHTLVRNVCQGRYVKGEDLIKGRKRVVMPGVTLEWLPISTLGWVKG